MIREMLLPFAAFRLEGVSPSWSWLWAVLLVAGAAVLYFAYRGIFQRSGQRLTWWLMGLRAVGLLLLALALAKPTWVRSREEVEPGHVAVVLDTSASMSLPDAGGTPRYDRARVAYERLRQALTARDGGATVAVDLFDIDGKPLRNGPPARLAAERTDLASALRQAAQQLRSRPLAGLVLISDGMDNTGRPNFSDWEDASLPVHGLGFRRPESGELDLRVRKPQVPERTLIHNEMRIEVPVAKSGKAPAEATVTLRRGREVLATRPVKLGPGDAEQLVPLTFTPRQAGRFVFTAAVESGAGERDASNNAVNFPLRVDADPIRVFYLEGFLRYEYKYLKARLEDDPDVALVSVVRRASPDGPAGQAEKVLLTAERLKDIDLVILGDMEGAFLSGAEYRALLGWLDGKNHSLLVLGGYNSFGPDGFRATPLAAALPVVFAAGPPYQSEAPFRLRLTGRGEGHPIFTLSSDRAKDAAAWDDAPPLEGMSLVERAKPGAVELAVNPLVVRDGKPAVVLAVQRAGGGGQVMVLTADTTWRWSRVPRVLGQADTLYSRFWSQAVRFLANRSTEDNRPPLTVSTEQPYYDVGKKVTIVVERQPRPDLDPATAQVTLDITGPDGKPLPPEQLPPLKATSENPDRLQADFYPAAGGRYEVAAALHAGGKLLTNQTAEFRAQGTDLERSDPGTNPDNLRALAEATGGYYFDVDDADRLAGKIVPRERRRTRDVTTPYWDSPWLFGGFLLAVTGEWFLRRRNHLV